MAGVGPAPKPDGQRIRRNKPTFEWVFLPAEGRLGEPPALPAWKVWSDATVEAWQQWWSTPQATMWDPSGRSLWRWVLMFDRMITDAEAPVTIHSQMLALEDRHGFSAAAMQRLRWAIVADEVSEKRADTKSRRKASAKAQTSALAARLKSV